MNSASWASYQAAAELPDRDDDGPPAKTIPTRVTPGKRYIEQSGFSRWDVYDWVREGCPCIGCVVGEIGETAPNPDCPTCKGTGDDGLLVPDRIACDLSESDARLVAFGADLVAACRAMRATMYSPKSEESVAADAALDLLNPQPVDVGSLEVEPWEES